MNSENNMVRLQKYIADCGVASRRNAEQIILDGRVSVNGRIVNELGVKVNAYKDIVKLDNKVIKPVQEKVYIMLNKPAGTVTTLKDQFDRDTVMDYVDIPERVFPIGRLDYDTSGLLLLTNDGELANKLMHPKFNINKTYVAKLAGVVTEDKLDRLRAGIKIEDYTTSPSHIEILDLKEKNSSVMITIHEGKNRQVRKMFETIGYNVLKLKRLSIGNITVENLREGKWRHLTKKEVEYLKKL